jgi:hypothetical protein
MKVRLFLLSGKIAWDSLLKDAEHFKKIPNEKLASFIKWLIDFRVQEIPYTEQQWQKLAESYDFKSVGEMIGANRFGGLIFTAGPQTRRSDLLADLQTLGFEKEQIKLIIDQFELAWAESEDFLSMARLEVIPILTSFRWRVDIRCASSNYLRKPEVIALIRIGASDKTKQTEMYFELNKDKVSWLETIVGEMKRNFLEAEESMIKQGTAKKKD